jgi:hypothetical protein
MLAAYTTGVNAHDPDPGAIPECALITDSQSGSLWKIVSGRQNGLGYWTGEHCCISHPTYHPTGCVGAYESCIVQFSCWTGERCTEYNSLLSALGILHLVCLQDMLCSQPIDLHAHPTSIHPPTAYIPCAYITCCAFPVLISLAVHSRQETTHRLSPVLLCFVQGRTIPTIRSVTIRTSAAPAAASSTWMKMRRSTTIYALLSLCASEKCSSGLRCSR